MVQENGMVMLSQKEYEGLLEYRQNWLEKERRERQGIKREMPTELREQLRQVEGLCSCGYIRSYYDPEAPEDYQYADSVKIHNFFCYTEEIVEALLEEDIEGAEDLIREYIKSERCEEEE